MVGRKPYAKGTVPLPARLFRDLVRVQGRSLALAKTTKAMRSIGPQAVLGWLKTPANVVSGADNRRGPRVTAVSVQYQHSCCTSRGTVAMPSR